MPSEEEQQPGPSGISREEVLTLLGLNTSDSEDSDDDDDEQTFQCHETLDESEDEEDRYCRLALDEFERQYEEEDRWCNQALEDYERQRAFQTQLLQQSGGGINPETPVGTFEFDLDPFVDRTSARMGARERLINARLRQTGNFIDTPHIAQALRDALRRAMTRVLNEIPNLHDDDRLFFTISSNRISRGDFHGWGVRVGEWRQGDGDRVDAMDGTFLETSVSKPTEAKPLKEKPPRSLNTVSASTNDDAGGVSNWKTDSNKSNVIDAVTWTVPPAKSMSTRKPTSVSFRKPPLLKKRKNKKRNANANNNNKGVLLPNGVLPLGFKPCGPTRGVMTSATTTTMMRMIHPPCTCSLTSKPCNPRKNTLPISSSRKPKRIRDPSVSKENIA